MSQSSTPAVTDAIYDASSLGRPRMFLLGLQHLFAMFGATVLVPVLTGLSVSATLLFAGLGTLLFHFLSRGRVPAFLGSSFAFIAGYAAIAPNGEAELLPYACLGVACAGLLYPVLAALFRAFGAKRHALLPAGGDWPHRHFHRLDPGKFRYCQLPDQLACCRCRRGRDRHMQHLGPRYGQDRADPAGRRGELCRCRCAGRGRFFGRRSRPWVGLPVVWDNTVFALVGPQFDSGLATTAIITIMPLAFATMIEHIGDISAIGSTCERNYIADPGLHRTLLGDGLATILASLFGAPANTTYGENTGVLALTRVFDPRVIRIAACCAIVLSFCPKFAAVIAAMPACVIGGVSLVLYGMISAVGVRNLIENQVDFQNNRNVLVTALVLVLSLGIAYSTAGAIVLELGGVTISLSGLAVGSLVGIVLNAILPGNDFEFDVSELEEAAE